MGVFQRKLLWTLPVAVGLVTFLAFPPIAEAQYIKDMARVKGIRTQHLNGPGLVVGLPGTGDSSRNGLTRKLYSNLLQVLEIDLSEEELKSRNIAVVMVTASVSSATKNGSTFDVTVSSMGDAKSLKGGWLLETQLMGPGEGGKETVYAIAQGPVDVKTVDEPTVGRGVAVLEEDISIPFQSPGNSFDIILHRPDFSTATRIARSINEFPYFVYTVPKELPLARAADAGSVRVAIPKSFRGADRVVDFISRVMGEVQVADVDRPAIVVINKEVGIVAVNGRVRVAPVFVSLGSVQIRIPPSPPVFRDGSEPPRQAWERQPLLIDVMEELKRQGIAPEQMPEIIRSIAQAGALVGELVEK